MTNEEFLMLWHHHNGAEFPHVNKLDVRIVPGTRSPQRRSSAGDRLFQSDCAVEIECEICRGSGPLIHETVRLPRLDSQSVDDVIQTLLNQLHLEVSRRREEMEAHPSFVPKALKPVLVIISGAGFSKPFGLPLTNELKKLVSEPCKKPESHFHAHEQYILQTYPLKEYLAASSSIPDFEYLLTLWAGYRHQLQYVDRRFADKHEVAYRRFLEHVCFHLVRLCDEIPNCKERLDRFDQLADWLRRVNERYDVRLLTFNYDVVWERLCEKAGLIFRYTDRLDPSNILIRKLHGSVNWFELRETQQSMPNREPMEVIHQSSGKHVCTYSDTKWPFFPSDKQPVPPVLIPPMAGKKYGHIYESIWSFANADISIADKLLIVGYSFPPLDVFAEKLLARTLSDRGKAVKYVLRKGANLDRVRSLLQRERITANFEEREWELTDFDSLL